MSRGSGTWSGGGLRWASLLGVLAMLAVACGGPADDGQAGSSPTEGESPAATSDAGGDGDQGGEAQPFTITLFGGSLNQILPRIAIEAGIFEQNGLKADVITVNSGPDMIATLLSGDAEFVPGPATVLYPVMQSENLVALMGNAGPDFNVIGRPQVDWPGPDSDPETRVAALEGKTVGVVALGGIVENYLLEVLSAAGLTGHEDVTIVATGGAATAVPAFENGEVDAMATFTPVETILGEAGEDFVYLANSMEGELNVFEDILVDFHATKQSVIDDRPDLVEAYCRSIWEARDYADDPANAEQIAGLIEEILGLTAEQASAQWENNRDLYQPQLSEERWSAQSEYTAEDFNSLFEQYDQFVYEPCATGQM